MRQSGHFPIQPYGHLAIHTSRHPDFWPSRHQTTRILVISPSGLLAIRIFGHLAIRTSDHLDFWPSCPKNVLIETFSAYLVGNTNLLPGRHHTPPNYRVCAPEIVPVKHFKNLPYLIKTIEHEPWNRE